MAIGTLCEIRRCRRVAVGGFGAALVAVGGLGFARPDAGASSTAPAYNTFHVAAGVVALTVAVRGRPAANRAFLVGFGAVDLYQALASRRGWFPVALFRWTPADDRLHLAAGTALLVLGGWPRRRRAT